MTPKPGFRIRIALMRIQGESAFSWMRIRIRILLLIKVTQICCSTAPWGLHFEPSRLSCERPQLHFEPLKLLTSFSPFFLEIFQDPYWEKRSQSETYFRVVLLFSSLITLICASAIHNSFFFKNLLKKLSPILSKYLLLWFQDGILKPYVVFFGDNVPKPRVEQVGSSFLVVIFFVIVIVIVILLSLFFSPSLCFCFTLFFI